MLPLIYKIMTGKVLPSPNIMDGLFKKIHRVNGYSMSNKATTISFNVEIGHKLTVDTVTHNKHKKMIFLCGLSKTRTAPG